MNDSAGFERYADVPRLGECPECGSRIVGFSYEWDAEGGPAAETRAYLTTSDAEMYDLCEQGHKTEVKR